MKTALLLLIFIFTLFAAPSYLQVRRAPRWSAELPTDTAFIYGVGVATGKGDLEVARKRAEQDALLKISQTIKVDIVSRVKSSLSADESGAVTGTYDEEIELFSKNSLTDCRIIEAALVKKSKTYWVLAALDRKAYNKKINAHFDNAVEIARQALASTYPKTEREEVSFLAMVRNLEEGMDAVAQFWGRPMYAEVNGERVLLNLEMKRRFEEIFNQLRLVPSTSAPVPVTTSGQIPNGVGASVYFGTNTVVDLPLSWTVNGAASKDAIPRENGFAPLPFPVLRGHSGDVQVSGTLAINSLLWRLKKRGVKVGQLPQATIVLRFAPRKVYVVFGAHTRDFVSWLTESGAAELSQSGLGLELSLKQEPAKLSRGLYHVHSSAVLKVHGASTRIVRTSVTAVGRDEVSAAELSKEQLYRKLLESL